MDSLGAEFAADCAPSSLSWFYPQNKAEISCKYCHGWEKIMSVLHKKHHMPLFYDE